MPMDAGAASSAPSSQLRRARGRTPAENWARDLHVVHCEFDRCLACGYTCAFSLPLPLVLHGTGMNRSPKAVGCLLQNHLGFASSGLRVELEV
jgi:hypothetical protein